MVLDRPPSVDKTNENLPYIYIDIYIYIYTNGYPSINARARSAEQSDTEHSVAEQHFCTVISTCDADARGQESRAK